MKLITSILLLIASTVSAEDLEPIELSPTTPAHLTPILTLVLNQWPIDGVSVENPPWAPASCAITIDGITYKCWCEEIDKPTACVAL